MTTPNASLAIDRLIHTEGGFVDDPDDPGEATRWGVSLRWLRSVRPGATAEDVRALTRDAAVALYREHWWDALRLGELADHEVAWRVLDRAVNVGPVPAVRILQLALRGTGHQVVVDGKLGPATRAAVVAAFQGGKLDELVHHLRAESAVYYAELIAAKPARAKWIRGWMRRAVA